MNEEPKTKPTDTMNKSLSPQLSPLSEFGPVIYAYTRSQAIDDGVQVDVTHIALEAGIRFPMFLTRAVYDAYVTVPNSGRAQAHGQDESGRLWDIVWMTRFAIIRANRSGSLARPMGEGGPQGRVRDEALTRLPVALYVRNDDERSRLVRLVAVCGPLDLDDPQPAITVMLPDED
jgi:hypothetical protein